MRVPPPPRRGDSDNTLINLLLSESRYPGEPLPAPPINVPARAVLRRLQRRLIAAALRAGRRCGLAVAVALAVRADVAGQGVSSRKELLFSQDVAQGLDAHLRVARDVDGTWGSGEGGCQIDRSTSPDGRFGLCR
jgi:hypothetical protein